MHILKRKTLVEFWEKYPDCKEQLVTWYKIIEKSSWDNPNQLNEKFPKSSILKGNRMVFRIKSYRLIVKFNFKARLCFIRWIGTHDGYDKIDANTI